MSLPATAQKTYVTAKDDQTGAVVFKGPITMADLSGEHSFSWMKRGETDYKPDSAAIKALRFALPAYTLVTFMGTWCDDSQSIIPKLAKVLQAARYPADKEVMYGVDRDKQTTGVESKIYDIKRVPTIIVFKGNKEVGRITESVSNSVEADLLQIVRRDAGAR